MRLWGLSEEKSNGRVFFRSGRQRNLCIHVALHSACSDTVSRQPSPNLNKQPQSHESLPDGLTLPTSPFLHKYFLWKGLLSSPRWKQPCNHQIPHSLKIFETDPSTIRYPQIAKLWNRRNHAEIKRQSIMQSQKITFLKHANLGLQVYFYCFLNWEHQDIWTIAALTSKAREICQMRSN